MFLIQVTLYLQETTAEAPFSAESHLLPILEGLSDSAAFVVALHCFCLVLDDACKISTAQHNAS